MLSPSGHVYSLKGLVSLSVRSYPLANASSDIIAELNCPMSNILNYEELMPAPNWAKLDLDHHVIQSYSGHIWLRKHLNTLHTMFYRPLPQGKKLHCLRFNSRY